MPENFVISPCQHCAGHIEFDATRAGESVACPHCGQETLLHIPPLQKSPPLLPKPATVVPQLEIPAGVKCPFCQFSDRLVIRKPVTTVGMILILIGIFLSPILIGIPLIIIGLKTTERKYQCGNCHKIF